MVNTTGYTINDALREINSTEWSEARLRKHFSQCGLGEVPQNGTLTDHQINNVKTIAGRVRQLPGTNVTQDEVVNLAISSGLELDVVAEAADRLQEKEYLVQYVEELVKQRTLNEIKRAARMQADAEELERQDAQLLDRLQSAVTSPAPDIEAIRQSLGVVTSAGVKDLAKWSANGQGANKAQQDFLSIAQQVTGAKK